MAKRGRPPKKNKDRGVEIIDKLNTLAINVLDDLFEKRRTGDSINFDDFKIQLLAIKEIKDLCKINAMRKDSFGSFFDQESIEEKELEVEDIFGLNELEEKQKEIEEEVYGDRTSRRTEKKSEA